VLRRSGELTEQQVTALDAIDRNTRAQAQLISDMLDGRQLPPKPAVKLGGARARDAPKSDWTLAGKRIVIVEDDIDGREVLGMRAPSCTASAVPPTRTTTSRIPKRATSPTC